MVHALTDQQVSRVLALICVLPGDSLPTDLLAAEVGMSSTNFLRVWQEQLGEPLTMTIHRLQAQCSALALTTNKPFQDGIGANRGSVSPRAFVDALRHLSCFMPRVFHRSERAEGNLEQRLSASYPRGGVEIISLAPFALIVKRGFEVEDPNLPTAAMDELWVWAQSRGLLPGLQGVYVIPGGEPQGKWLMALRYDAGIDFDHGESRGSLPAGQHIVNVAGGNWARARFRGPFLGVEAACLHLYGAWMWASKRGLVGAPLFAHYLGGAERDSLAAWQTDVYLPLKPLEHSEIQKGCQ